MNYKQYLQTCSFAMRMAKCCCPTACQDGLLDHVRGVLGCMASDACGFHYSHIIDWDNAVKHPTNRWRILCYAPGDFLAKYCWDNDLGEETEDGWKDNLIGSALRCCIRAALDIATTPSGGVVGYDVGDLRSMWSPKPIPAWVQSFFPSPITATMEADTPLWL